jgi:nicotinamide phosphoribosyltransferase
MNTSPNSINNQYYPKKNMNGLNNPILKTDSYKESHGPFYPPGTTKVHSYFTCRKGGAHDEIVFFGLQMLLKELTVPITKEMVKEAKTYFEVHMATFDSERWYHIVNEHDGRLPLTIWAVPEGTVCKAGDPLIVVENTDPKCFWLTNYVETLLVQVWAPTTVATNSYHMKKDLMSALKMTGSVDSWQHRLHDFGCRGVSSMQSAAMLGCAHLAVGFSGTDTVPALVAAREVYDEHCAGFSIRATEHSVVTAFGDSPLDELKAFGNYLSKVPDDAIVAYVCDSYNIYQFIQNIIGHVDIKKKILSRSGCLVIRPDSGDPPSVVVDVLEALETLFPTEYPNQGLGWPHVHTGTTINEHGYKVLPPQLRVIQGDGIDAKMMVKILVAITQRGWSADNIAFGSGGGLLQKFNRDTLKCAFKASYIEVNGVGRDIYKTPIDAPGKNSRKGKIPLGSMALVYDNGVTICQKFDDIRKRNHLTWAYIPQFHDVCIKHGIDPRIAQAEVLPYNHPQRNRPFGYSKRVASRAVKYAEKEFREYKVTF